jgi:acetyl coenzyme A synthetase (ADP forming)-like protein
MNIVEAPANPRPETALYPSHHERYVVLSNGATLLLRPVLAGDRKALAQLFSDLSAESTYARFLEVKPRLESLLDQFVAVDYHDTFTLVGEADGRIVGTASYFRDPKHPTRAEVAFTIADEWQGRGIGTLLLEHLARPATDAGIESFDAWTRADNHQMLGVFRMSGFTITSAAEGSLVRVSLSLGATETYAERHAERSARAAYASIKPFFEPQSVAVIGASRSRAKIGGQVFANIRSAEYRGALYAVNPTTDEIDGIRSFPTVSAIPDPVDLAVITVPAPAVEEVVDECIRKGVKALVVITAGFAEVGAAGRAAQDAILDRVRRAGVRLVGPNCMGLLNTAAGTRLNSTFAAHLPPAGRVAMSTQSGALGLAILDYAEGLDLGLSSFVSVGNKADVSGNDLIQYWGEDENTDVILLYLESFGNPRKFAEIARRTSMKKPIVAVKAGRSQAGHRAASSHTGALATDDAVVEALFEQCGVIRTHTLEELFDVANLLAHQPLPGGKRVAILTNAGGAAILAADACEAEGLTVAPVSDTTVAELRTFLPAAASTGNPIDMIASATPEQYRRAIPILLNDPAVDSLIVVYVPPVVSDPQAIAEAIAAGTRDAGSGKPVLVTFTYAQGPPKTLRGLPTYAFPERAATALARVTTYAEWRRTATPAVHTRPSFQYHEVRARLQKAVDNRVDWLSPADVEDVLRSAGLPLVQSAFAATEEEAVQAAARIGFPVALKAVGPEIIHKTEVKGIRLGLTDEAAVREACRSLKGALGARLTGYLMQQMAPEGPEFLVGCVSDPLFGPVIACGAGGTLAELLGDVSFRLPPLTGADATSMLAGMRSVKLLHGFRGEAPRDQRALEQVLARVSELVDTCPEIAEMDLNPVRVYQEGALVLDARIKLASLHTRRPSRRVDY